MYGVSDLLRTCYEFLSAHIKKRSTSAYEEYELRIEEYELRMATYLRRTCNVPFVSRYAVDTRVDTRMCDSPISVKDFEQYLYVLTVGLRPGLTHSLFVI